jgi:hypothetical protein
MIDMMMKMFQLQKKGIKIFYVKNVLSTLYFCTFKGSKILGNSSF